MATDLQIVNGAYNIIGREPIAAITGADAQKARTQIAPMARVEFSTYDWNFAAVVRELRMIKDTSPYNTQRYAVYERPPEALRVFGLFIQDYGSYRWLADPVLDADGIHTYKDDNLRIKYVRQVPSEKWPAEFARVIEARVAAEIVGLQNPEAVARVEHELMRRQRIARSSDEQDNGDNVTGFDTSRYIAVRTAAGLGRPNTGYFYPDGKNYRNS